MLVPDRRVNQFPNREVLGSEVWAPQMEIVPKKSSHLPYECTSLEVREGGSIHLVHQLRIHVVDVELPLQNDANVAWRGRVRAFLWWSQGVRCHRLKFLQRRVHHVGFGKTTAALKTDTSVLREPGWFRRSSWWPRRGHSGQGRVLRHIGQKRTLTSSTKLRSPGKASPSRHPLCLTCFLPSPLLLLLYLPDPLPWPVCPHLLCTWISSSICSTLHSQPLGLP